MKHIAKVFVLALPLLAACGDRDMQASTTAEEQPSKTEGQCTLEIVSHYDPATLAGIPTFVPEELAVSALASQVAQSILPDDALRAAALSSAQRVSGDETSALWESVENGEAQAQFQVELVSPEKGWRVTRESILLPAAECEPVPTGGTP